ncbi:MAG: hypothetical protein ACF8TS_03605 [Maioricimonas sp. JB049]
MNTKQIALLLGGVLPALLLGVSGIFQKLSTSSGSGTGPFLIVVGGTTAVVGGLFLLNEPDTGFNLRSSLFAGLFGIVWAVSMGLIAIALGRFDAQISQLVPLYNMNTLVAVGLGLVFLAEWRNVNSLQLLLASLLIIAGGILAARA